MFVVDKTALGQAEVQQKHCNEITMQINACDAVAFQLKMAEMDSFWGHWSFFRIPAGIWKNYVCEPEGKLLIKDFTQFILKPFVCV